MGLLLQILTVFCFSVSSLQNIESICVHINLVISAQFSCHQEEEADLLIRLYYRLSD